MKYRSDFLTSSDTKFHMVNHSVFLSRSSYRDFLSDVVRCQKTRGASTVAAANFSRLVPTVSPKVIRLLNCNYLKPLAEFVRGNLLRWQSRQYFQVIGNNHQAVYYQQVHSTKQHL